MGVEKKICETCAHYHECGTRLVINVMENNIKCKAYKERPRLSDEKPSNADRIRSMTDEELAEFIQGQIIDRNIGIPTEAWLDWLKQEVKE